MRRMNTKLRHAALYASAALVAVVLGVGANLALSQSTRADCCYPGAPCCYPGSPCCAHDAAR